MRISRFDVFIPGAFPEYTYVNRTFINSRTKEIRDPEREVSDALQQKGRVVLVSGPSKSGKTIVSYESAKSPNAPSRRSKNENYKWSRT